MTEKEGKFRGEYEIVGHEELTEKDKALLGRVKAPQKPPEKGEEG